MTIICLVLVISHLEKIKKISFFGQNLFYQFDHNFFIFLKSKRNYKIVNMKRKGNLRHPLINLIIINANTVTKEKNKIFQNCDGT